MADWATRHFHPHQYVKVNVSVNKTEIGIVVSADEDKVIVATRHGYNITAKPKQLQRAFLLVLDLNGVLGARQKKTLFERRPHLEQFLKFALANFVVAVWTSCEERNGKQIVEDLFSDDRDRLLFCLYRGDCVPNPTPERPFGTSKNLQRIFDEWPESFHAVNTVIVDDSADKCSHPDIALCPSQFSGIADQPDDEGLLAIISVLQRVLDDDSLDPLIEAAAESRRQLLLTETAQQRCDAPSCIANDINADAALAAITSSSSVSEYAVPTPARKENTKTLCCYFLSNGYCKYGDDCRFSHVDDGVSLCNRKCKRHQTARIGSPTSETTRQLTSDALGSTTSGQFAATINNRAADLLAKLTATAQDEGRDVQLELNYGLASSRQVSGFFDNFDSGTRRQSHYGTVRSAQYEPQSPMKQPPVQQRHFHQQHHQRSGNHHQGASTVHQQPNRDVVSIFQNAQRLTAQH
ncbi:Hypothetical protein, putative [Bodo saltans]|uniref:Mitochondrial import inner membrane translocase subunit TIM50 n=1 Tax=Bodo saltans TaxID=75058 RepID=A0A0S4J258_BODSA|nr:Hypothetical protein, putative [Bodo saltans]|eukprot:CUG84191.1 Hypothetical protein, putative [Bodo saltans]